jgi:hypothetical protein
MSLSQVTKNVKEDGLGKYIESSENKYARKETGIKKKLDEIDKLVKEEENQNSAKKCPKCKKCGTADETSDETTDETAEEIIEAVDGSS